MTKKYFFLFLFCTLASNTLFAQKASIGSNIPGYANFLTINAEASYAVAKNFTVTLQGKYNPWTFNKNKAYRDHVQNRQISIAAGARYWFWHVYSGWFVGSQFQFTQYNSGGIKDPITYEGNLYGLGLNMGYSLMLNKHFNIDFGAGMIIGPTTYTKYACPKCGKILEADKKRIYIGPNNLLIQLSYLF